MSGQPEIDPLFQKATELHERGALAEADAIYQRIIAGTPAHRDAIQRRIIIAHQNGRPADALPILDAAARAEPANATWPLGRALVLALLGRGGEAVQAYDHAIALNPGDPALHHDRAATLMLLNRYPEALAGFDMMAMLDPKGPRALTGRGGVLWRMRRYDEAMAAYDRAIEIQEDHAESWYAKSLLLLLLGQYKEGWELHEWRLWQAGEPDQRLFRQPVWDGAAFHGQTLLIHTEPGLGETIQFYRFAAQARAFGRAMVEVDERLVRLLRAQSNGPAIIPRGQDLPAFDLQIPIKSLPLLLGTELRTLPAPNAYLHADPALARVWAPRLPPAGGRPRVGIVWSGNPAVPYNASRSIPLVELLSALGPDLAVVSLQKDMTESDRLLLAKRPDTVDLGDDLTDFADTAAVISGLDLVISVCTSAAHLAGALGKPVWVLLSTSADWRWLRDREDSPWYPSARLFRQDAPGDWAAPLGRLAEALKALPAV